VTKPGANDAPPPRCDLAIVGGGIVGLAVARELALRRPRETVCVLEGERELGLHQTSHNSGVIHAGLYYAPGSLKARLCAEGLRTLYEYCEERGIETRASGKLVVAVDSSELGRLDALAERARANGVPGLRRVGEEEIRAFEPACAGIAGLHSPRTGVADFSLVARGYADDVRAAGGLVATGAEVRAIRPRNGSIELDHARGGLSARYAVFCAGAASDRLAVLAGADADPRIVPFRGTYLRLGPTARGLVRSLIYPVPDPALPFLGVHFTRGLDDEVLLGPTAQLAATRDGRSLRAAGARDLLDTVRWPGSPRLLRRFWRTALREWFLGSSKRALVRAARRYVPALAEGDVEPCFAGVRAQAVSRDGRLVDDFALSHTERALHVRNAPSPAATASLAIAREVADRVEAQLAP
jgi:2-hydroxyglutarate dehydrogenase